MSGLYLIGIVKDIGIQLAGLNEAAAANAVALIALFNTSGRLVLGALSDKTSRLGLIGGALAVTAAAVFTLSFAELNYGLFFSCVAAIAFCFGGNITIFPAIVGDFFGLANHSKTTASSIRASASARYPARSSPRCWAASSRRSSSSACSVWPRSSSRCS
ncbi:hypothetical protein HMSSN036_72650 [Paenibacillus macerans]|nr:hypothetical protein HMSSN036_72650 [Paenibacillus macerans]